MEIEEEQQRIELQRQLAKLPDCLGGRFLKTMDRRYEDTGAFWEVVGSVLDSQRLRGQKHIDAWVRENETTIKHMLAHRISPHDGDGPVTLAAYAKDVKASRRDLLMGMLAGVVGYGAVRPLVKEPQGFEGPLELSVPAHVLVQLGMHASRVDDKNKFLKLEKRILESYDRLQKTKSPDGAEWSRHVGEDRAAIDDGPRLG